VRWERIDGKGEGRMRGWEEEKEYRLKGLEQKEGGKKKKLG